MIMRLTIVGFIYEQYNEYTSLFDIMFSSFNSHMEKNMCGDGRRIQFIAPSVFSKTIKGYPVYITTMQGKDNSK